MNPRSCRFRFLSPRSSTAGGEGWGEGEDFRSDPPNQGKGLPLTQPSPPALPGRGSNSLEFP